MINKFIINGAAITDIPSLYVEVNRVFMKNVDWQLGQSLDAFNDLLYGGFGAIDACIKNEIIWLDANQSKSALGFQTTIAYYQNKLSPGSPFNKELFLEKIEELKAGNGKTYYEIIKEIIAEHPHIILKEK